MTVHEVLSKLQGVKKSGDGWVARCVSHEDRSPSLSIKENADGAVLLKCHTGCSIDAICAGLQIEPKDLFPQNGNGSHPKREIVATYDYTDLDGTLLFQAVRYSPKGFSQRAPDGHGGWKYSLAGVKRVLYRLPELKGHPAILICEGEKDVDAAWKLGIPATCNPMGAGKWTEDFTQQLKTIGTQRAAVMPDNDAPGASHAEDVGRSVLASGRRVKIVTLPGLPPHGDLSDYLATHTRDELYALIRDTPDWDGKPVGEDDCTFEVLEDHRYRMRVKSAAIQFEIERLKRDREGSAGELTVTATGFLPKARHLRGGVIHWGDLNLRAVQTRKQWATQLAERSGDKETDWYGLLEDFAIRVTMAERQGEPIIALRDVVVPPESDLTWDVNGVPVLAYDPMVFFGDPSCGKSYLAIWIASQLGERGLPVLYVDWEGTKFEQRKRFAKLISPMPANVYYLTRDRPLVRVVDGIVQYVREKGIKYVICDSVSFALDGSPLDAEAATSYFAHARRFGVGSLHLAHIPKHVEEGQQPTIFGSQLFRAGARSTWFVDRTSNNPNDDIRVGLYHRKYNYGKQLPPLGYHIQFENHRTVVERIDIAEVEELAANLPLHERMARLLADGPLTVKQMADDLAVAQNMVRARLSRHGSLFRRNGQKWDLAKSTQSLEF